MVYADRVRIRQPGDAGFALGPHVDGGSLERWEEDGYGLGSVYGRIWKGKWEEYDPWESSCRLPVKSDLYNGSSACSVFRMFQGWLSMSTTGPNEGSRLNVSFHCKRYTNEIALLVNPMLSLSTAYYLLRPFFMPRNPSSDTSNFLDSSNWQLEPDATSLMQGAHPGHGQELNSLLHPHLELGTSMVHIPRINPGDYVAWHCDSKLLTIPENLFSISTFVLY